MKWLLALLLLPSTITKADYEFSGKHLIATYRECDVEALTDAPYLLEALVFALRQSALTVEGHICKVFPGGGCTVVILLAESHASIHTYPEYSSCFVDCFSCGSADGHESFFEAVKELLGASVADYQLISRI